MANEHELALAPPPQTLAVPPPPHVWGELHEPQLSVPPQPSLIAPQFFPWAEQVVGVQLVPQTLAVPPPPHVEGDAQLPPELTVRLLPQLSVPVTLPQFFPRREQKAPSDSGVQVLPPQTLATPPPPHV